VVVKPGTDANRHPKPLATRAPFRAKEMGDDEAAKAYHGAHGLREMYTRENTERRRIGGHTLRRYLTAAQDKLLTAQFTKVRAEWAVENNSDATIVFAQRLIAEGKEAELHPELAKIAKATAIPKRARPFDDARDH
jgi:hypothetical protein